MKRSFAAVFSIILAVFLLITPISAYADTTHSTVVTLDLKEVTVKGGSHGSYTVDGVSYTGDHAFRPALGADITITIVPDSGYLIDAITGDGAEGMTIGAGGDTVSIKGGTLEISFKKDPEDVASAAITGLTAPAKGETLDTDAEYEGGSLTVAWSPADTTAKADTVYTATITVTPGAGEKFTTDTAFTIGGKTPDSVTLMPDGTAVITMTFPATAPESGTISCDVVIDTGAPDVTIDKDELKDIIEFTTDELSAVAGGEAMSLWLEVTDVSATISAAEKSALDSAASAKGYTAGEYVAVSLYKELSGSTTPVAVTTTKKSLVITLKIPASLINSDPDIVRTYAVVRSYGGVAEVLTATYDEATQTLSFTTDKFSNFSIAYCDTEKNSDKKPGSGDTQDTSSNGGSGTDQTSATDQSPAEGQDTTSDVTSARSPRTGDNNDLTIWLILGAVSAAGMILIVAAGRRRTR